MSFSAAITQNVDVYKKRFSRVLLELAFDSRLCLLRFGLIGRLLLFTIKLLLGTLPAAPLDSHNTLSVFS